MPPAPPVIPTLLLLALASSAAGQSTAPATTRPADPIDLATLTDASNADASRLSAGIGQRFEVACLPSLGKLSPDSLVEFRVHDGVLVALTTLPATDGEAGIDTLPDPRIARVTVMGKEPGLGEPASLNLVVRRYDRPGTLCVQTEVHAIADANSLQINQDIETAATTTTVTLLQASNQLAADQVDPNARIRLIVRVSDNESGDAPVAIDIAAPSITDLLRRHRAVAILWLRPVFRELGQDAPVFAADARLAWQVLPIGYTPDPAMRSRVDAVIARLDADAAPAREAAARDLAALGEPAARLLLRSDRTRLTPQQFAAVEAFLEPHKPLSTDDITRLASDVAFLLDCLELPDTDLRRSADGRLREVLRRPIDFDPAGPEPRRDAQLIALREALLPASPTTAPNAAVPKR